MERNSLPNGSSEEGKPFSHGWLRLFGLIGTVIGSAAAFGSLYATATRLAEAFEVVVPLLILVASYGFRQIWKEIGVKDRLPRFSAEQISGLYTASISIMSVFAIGIHRTLPDGGVSGSVGAVAAGMVALTFVLAVRLPLLVTHAEAIWRNEPVKGHPVVNMVRPRLVARCIDMSAVVIISVGLAAAAGYYGWSWFLPEGGVALFLVTVSMLYEDVAAVAFGHGRSLGKKLMSLRVTDSGSGCPVKWGKSAVRSLFLHLPLLIWSAPQLAPLGVDSGEPWLLAMTTTPYALWLVGVWPFHDILSRTSVAPTEQPRREPNR